MDILKTLINWIPTAPMIVRIAFFLLTSGVIGWYSFLYVPSQVIERNASVERRLALAYMLGWNSMTILQSNGNNPALLAQVDATLREFRVALPKPSIEYFNISVDGGAGAQQYAEIVAFQLQIHESSGVLNHFIAARNIGLAAGGGGDAPESNKVWIESAAKLNLPSRLSIEKFSDKREWAHSVGAYFLGKLGN